MRTRRALLAVVFVALTVAFFIFVLSMVPPHAGS